MRPAELEFWILGVADTVALGQQVEDARVECKRDWPDPGYRTARRLAGHLNAASGESVLWVIGVDERRVPFAGPANKRRLTASLPSVGTSTGRCHTRGPSATKQPRTQDERRGLGEILHYPTLRIGRTTPELIPSTAATLSGTHNHPAATFGALPLG